MKTSEMGVERLRGEIKSLQQEMAEQLENARKESEDAKNEQDRLILRIKDEKEDILNQK